MSPTPACDTRERRIDEAVVVPSIGVARLPSKCLGPNWRCAAENLPGHTSDNIPHQAEFTPREFQPGMLPLAEFPRAGVLDAASPSCSKPFCPDPDETMDETRWQFWIDVGGTFTDCVARHPDGSLQTWKSLSSGRVTGRTQQLTGPNQFIDTARADMTAGFWKGWRISISAGTDHGDDLWESTIIADDPTTGCLTCADSLLDDLPEHARYELASGEEAPLNCIRGLLDLPLTAPIPPIDVRLGTTRGTNALLERKGARTAFVTTVGFADLLVIGTQDRPRLFDLAINKPAPLYETVVEIDERLDAEGHVLTAPDPDRVGSQLEALRADGIEALAICLLHSYRNPAHEQLVEQISREIGFEFVSCSSAIAPVIKAVSRAETTVLDAYLNPVLAGYVQRIQNSLGPDSRLRIMTSAGGLVDAGHFSGKDSILSGPAGGVVGFARVAEQAGFRQAIGFDMGGTSTDVARYGGRFEIETETRKADVRIVTPTLAIETVAAGGGSICSFDGLQLHVGPASAGADPGPACYGRGGPLTISDINLALGRLLPHRFPFPLDTEVVWSKLSELCDEIAASPLQASYTPVELAEGFAAIANERMARAVRRISVQRGYDPTEHALVTFGGAGAQHACAMARSLGVQSVVIPPFAGILSAYGIGLADVRRHGECSVLKPYSTETLTKCEPELQRIEHDLRRELRAEGLREEQIAPPNRTLALRYAGAESTILVPTPDDGDYAAAFIDEHRRLYGYVHPNRPLEIVTAHVELVASSSHGRRSGQVLERDGKLEPRESASVYFDGAYLDTPVYEREQLVPGNSLCGPALVCSAHSTIVVEPGFNLVVNEFGDLLLTRQSGERHEERRAQDSFDDDEADPILLEIFNNRFASIAEQMGVTLQRTSVSTNVKERLDYSCAVFDAEGRLVVNAPHIPVHLGAMGETVRCLLADNPDMKPGDVFLTNDPYRGGSHLPDLTAVTPVHDATGEHLLFFTASRAHHAEIGGIVPGSMPSFSRNLAEEGILISNFKLLDSGESREAELRELLGSGPYPSRSIEDNMADVAAQVAANQTGVRLLQMLVEEQSLARVTAYMQHIQESARLKTCRALSRLPITTGTFQDALDDGSPIAVSLTIRDEHVEIDFTGTGPVVPTNLNANRAIVTAAVMYVLRCLIDEDIPLNHGVLAPLTLHLPECLLNPPRQSDPKSCPAVVGGNVETSQRVVDVLLGALERAAASQGTMNNLSFGDDSFGYYETICGGSGATPEAAGADAVHTHMTNTRLTDVEVIEHRYPVRLRRFTVRRGSGGAGLHRGGDGVVREFEFLKPLAVSLLTQRRGSRRPFGLAGGEAGLAGRQHLLRVGRAQAEDLPASIQVDVAAGDRLVIETPGGGGYGSTTAQKTAE